MTKFRIKPIDVEAVQYNGENESEIVLFTEYKTIAPLHGRYLTVSTEEGVYRLYEGDWIIKGPNGELFPFKPGVFEAIHEPVNEWS